MANSACPKCGNHSFEMVTNSPSGSNYKFNFIQCAAYGCGTVVGVVDYFHLPTKIEAVQKAVDSKFSPSGGSNQQLSQNVQALFQNISILNTKLNKILEKLEEQDQAKGNLGQ